MISEELLGHTRSVIGVFAILEPMKKRNTAE
jgi:hypothetical protein